MPRDKDKDNDSRRDRRDGGARKGRSGKPRGPEKKLAKRGFGARGEEGGRFSRGDRDSRPGREDRRERRGDFDDAPRGGRFRDNKSGDKRSYSARDDFGKGRARKEFGDRDSRPGREDRRPPRRDFDDAPRERHFRDKESGDRRSFSGPGEFRKHRPGKEFGGRDRGDEKPWRKREDRRPEDRRRDERGGERPRFSRPREERSGEDRPKFGRPRFDRPREERQRPEGRTEWQEHPRSEGRFSDRRIDRPRRDEEGEGRRFEKRPAFGGRGAYRERKGDFDRRPAREPAKPKKTGERIAKVLARAGLASRRDAEEWIVQGRVTVNGRIINSPALDVTRNDVIAVDGKPLPPRERTRLFLYHKPRGLMTTHADPEGRPTVFDNLPEGLPRLISVGRLDFNTEGLLLLTNDGGLARVLELPETGWLRRYRVRAHGEITQAHLDELKNGVEVDGVKYGSIDATLEREQGSNVWLVFAIREGKNREVRNVLAHLGLEVNRLIRVSYGPFQLGELTEGEVQEVKTRVLREQLGEKVVAQAGVDFAIPATGETGDEDSEARREKPFKPRGKNALIEDRKGRRVLVQRAGSEEARARNELEAAGYGPPRRPRRTYHGKRDLKPREE